MKTKEGATIIIVALVAIAGLKVSGYELNLRLDEEASEARRTQAVRDASEPLLKSLETQISGATNRPATCSIEDKLFVELIPKKTYRAIVLCDDGEILLSTVIDVTRFGADDELYLQTDGFRPASKE